MEDDAEEVGGERRQRGVVARQARKQLRAGRAGARNVEGSWERREGRGAEGRKGGRGGGREEGRHTLPAVMKFKKKAGTLL